MNFTDNECGVRETIPLIDDANPLPGVLELKHSLLERFPLLGFTQTVRSATRHGANITSSFIDHSWLNNMNKFI